MNGVGRAELSRSVTLNPVLGVYLLQIETNSQVSPLYLPPFLLADDLRVFLDGGAVLGGDTWLAHHGV